MSSLTPTGDVTSSVLIVDGDVITRHAIAEYLRQCGYAVVEGANTYEALKALGELSLGIDGILCDAGAVGSRSAFELSTWVRSNRPELEVRLAGSLESIAKTAAQLRESGPHLARPYKTQAFIEYIKQLRAARDRSTEA